MKWISTVFYSNRAGTGRDHSFLDPLVGGEGTWEKKKEENNMEQIN